ncbi:hypothetical protein GGI35DRAFT_109386 [Trichoderma velutinum]
MPSTVEYSMPSLSAFALSHTHCARNPARALAMASIWMFLDSLQLHRCNKHPKVAKLVCNGQAVTRSGEARVTMVAMTDTCVTIFRCLCLASGCHDLRGLPVPSCSLFSALCMGHPLRMGGRSVGSHPL